jgi:hypothetical protein
MFSLSCGESDGSLSVALKNDRSTIAENQGSWLTFSCDPIICTGDLTSFSVGFVA